MIELKPCPFCGGKAETFPLDKYDSYENHERLWYAECRNCFSRSGYYDTEGEAAIAWNTRSSGWISCSERMPEDGVNVLIYSSRKEVSKAFYDSDMHRYYIADSDYSYSELDITHWMPLPEHPEGGVDDAKP